MIDKEGHWSEKEIWYREEGKPNREWEKEMIKKDDRKKWRNDK